MMTIELENRSEHKYAQLIFEQNENGDVNVLEMTLQSSRRQTMSLKRLEFGVFRKQCFSCFLSIYEGV